MRPRPLPSVLTAAVSTALLVGSSAVAVTTPAGAVTPAPTAHFAKPSSIASIGPWIVVTNRATSTLSLLIGQQRDVPAHRLARDPRRPVPVVDRDGDDPREAHRLRGRRRWPRR